MRTRIVLVFGVQLQARACSWGHMSPPSTSLLWCMVEEPLTWVSSNLWTVPHETFHQVFTRTPYISCVSGNYFSFLILSDLSGLSWFYFILSYYRHLFNMLSALNSVLDQSLFSEALHVVGNKDAEMSIPSLHHWNRCFRYDEGILSLPEGSGPGDL